MMTIERRPLWTPTPTPAGAVIGHHPAARPAPIDAPTISFHAPPSVAEAAPPKARRVRGVDAARGLALIGMIAAHTLPLAEGDQPTWIGRIVNGPAAALFGVLAGLSVALLTGRRRVEPGTESARSYALRLVVRGLAIGTVGLALGQAELSSIDVILTYYGLLFVLAVPLVFLSTRILVLLGAMIAVVAPVTGFLLRAQLPTTELLDPSFTMLVTDPAGLLTTLLFTGAYPAWPWLAYLCAGIAVGRLRLDRTHVAAALAVGGAVLAVVATVASEMILRTAGGIEQVLATPGLPSQELATLLAEGPNGVTPTTSWWWLAVTLPHSSTTFDLTRTLGISLAVLGLMLLLDRLVARSDDTRSRVLSAARGPLAAAGSMTLTLYVLHILASGLAPEGGGSWGFFLGQVLVAVAVGALWQRYVGRGPLETGVAKLTNAVVPAPSRTTVAATASPRAGASVQTAIAVAALVLAVAVGAGVALAFPASADTSSSTTADSDTSEGPPDGNSGADPADSVEEPVAGTSADSESGDAGDTTESDNAVGSPQPDNNQRESGEEG